MSGSEPRVSAEMLRSTSTPDTQGDGGTAVWPRTAVAGVYSGPHFGSGLTINTAAGLYETRT